MNIFELFPNVLCIRLLFDNFCIKLDKIFEIRRFRVFPYTFLLSDPCSVCFDRNLSFKLNQNKRVCIDESLSTSCSNPNVFRVARLTFRVCTCSLHTLICLKVLQIGSPFRFLYTSDTMNSASLYVCSICSSASVS